MARPERVLDTSTPRACGAVWRSDLDIVEHALDELGPAIRAGYECSTDPVPAHCVYDDVGREAR